MQQAGRSESKTRLVEKVLLYIFSDSRQLLVLEHPDHPEAGLQVPAGTLEPGESPAAGALREAEEETGLQALVLVRSLGILDFDARPYGKPELHRRHVFELRAQAAPEEPWEHWELDPAEGSGPIRFRLLWMEPAQAKRELIAEMGAGL